jgi:DNA polymerase (family 10)
VENHAYAQLLEDTAALMEIAGESIFRVRAFERAAKTLSSLARSIEAAMDDGTLLDLDGIGKSIAGDLRQIRARGSFDALDDLRKKLPAGMLELTRVQGLGPKKIKRLYDELGIGDLAALEAAIQAGKVAQLQGFGVKTQDNLQKEIDRLRRSAGRRPLPGALSVAAPILERLRALPQVARAELAGSARRGRETVKDLDFVVATDDPAPVMDAFIAAPGVTEVIAHGPTKTSVILLGDLQADLRAVRPGQFGTLLHHFTGSKEHHVELRKRARQMGLTISEYGVLPIDAPEGTAPLAAADEADVYRALGLPWIPPELREAQGEIEAAERGALPALLTRADLRGDLHMHTTASDGANTIREMAEAALALGYAYIAITDHSKSSTIANGLDEARLRRHMADIDAVDRELGGAIRVLKGIEVDILKDGSLDLPGDLLDELDFVVGSVHASMKQDKPTMTARVLRAIESGHLHAIGHPTGRLLGERDPFELDFDPILAACRSCRVALEINASAGRLDLKDTHARMAAEAGVMLTLSTDSHSTRGFEQVAFGVTVARRGWLTAQHVLNTRPWDELQAWYAERG